MENAMLDMGDTDPDFESVEEAPPFHVDLDDFPNPSDFMCLEVYGLTTEREFIAWWRARTGDTIRKFRNFTPVFQPGLP